MEDRSGSVTEKLRGKHVRTLELLEQVVNERNALLKRVEELESSAGSHSQPEVHTNQLNGPSLEIDPRVKELEEKVLSGENALRAVEAKLKGKLTESFRQVTERDVLIASLQEENTNLKDENEKMLAIALDTSQLDTFKLEVRTLSEALDVQKRKNDVLIREAESMRAQHEGELAAAALQGEESEGALASLQAQLGDLGHANVALERELDNYRQDVSVGNKERAELRKQLERLSKEMISTVDPQQTELAGELGRVKAENEALNLEVERLVKCEKDLKQQVTQLQKQASSGGGERKASFAAHINMKKENQLLKMQLEDMRAINRKFVGKPIKNNVSMSSLSGGRR